MLNKKRTKFFIFSLIIFTLLINLVYLSYEKIYKDGNYAADNNKIISYYENNQINISLKDERQIICSNLKTPFGNVELYYKLVSLSVLATIISMITVFWALILKWRKKIGLSRKNAFIIMSVELVSLLVFVWAFMLESDYYFTYCVHF